MSTQGSQTSLDASEVRKAGNAIGDIADDVNGFSELNDVHPKAGDFAVGSWLNQLIAARRDTLHQHCNDLQRTLREVSEQLKNIATEIEQTDRNNGEQLDKLNAELQSSVNQLRSQNPTLPMAPKGPDSQNGFV
ncbi:Excreted virulence factor EspC, type VII ESX diderm [Actinopolyspora lacussalsi subsp. righensis]|uniref:Excreted virulence factor EspC, type VII ESX diderm n=1 Tax=Actinopolyspora righensis TaxID=995060 RepID=A0A1I6XB98_9ACTN|nr:type VII secretion target [Actinopolyspora righensis]SFT35371.1 Excreted virulence factor EspC, type VII ESX diderm [Actinopolyspora righensis]